MPNVGGEQYAAHKSHARAASELQNSGIDE